MLIIETLQVCWQAASWRLLQYEMLLSSHDGRYAEVPVAAY